MVINSKCGDKSAVHMEEQKGIVHLWVDKNGLAPVIITDDQYPTKVGFQILNEIFKVFYENYDLNKFKGLSADTNINFTKIDEYLKNYQDPKEADKLFKLESTLQDITGIIHKTLDDVILINSQ